jgi:hypothetical protein
MHARAGADARKSQMRIGGNAIPAPMRAPSEAVSNSHQGAVSNSGSCEQRSFVECHGTSFTAPKPAAFRYIGGNAIPATMRAPEQSVSHTGQGDRMRTGSMHTEDAYRLQDE